MIYLTNKLYKMNDIKTLFQVFITIINNKIVIKTGLNIFKFNFFPEIWMIIWLKFSYLMTDHCKSGKKRWLTLSGWLSMDPWCC